MMPSRAHSQGVAPRASSSGLWVGSWAAAQQVPEPQNALAADDLRDATLRQVVHLSVGGRALRVHLSNAFGTTPLRLDAAHLALAARGATVAGGGEIDAATDHTLTFAGAETLEISPGAELISDPVEMSVPSGADVVTSIHIPKPPTQQTGHPGSRATSYLVHGNLLSAVRLPDAKRVEHWYTLSAVDVETTRPGWSIVALGDSITDGHGATTDGNDRWPDDLARRLAAPRGMEAVGVLNAGIGGNHLLTDGLGPNALARFDRDVLGQTGARIVVVLEGVNDLGMMALSNDADPQHHATKVASIIAAYGQIVLRAHAAGLRVMGCTVLPYEGSGYYHPTPQDLEDLVQVNAWIRTPGHFDAVVDLAAVVADPQHPTRLRPEYDSGDHLHPSPAGYRAMAAAFDLKTLARLATR